MKLVLVSECVKHDLERVGTRPCSALKRLGSMGNSSVSARGILRDPAGSCGILRDPVGSCGILRDPAGSCGILRDLAGSCGSLWEPVGACGSLWEPAGSCGILRDPAGSCGNLWEPVGACGILWVPVGTLSPLQVLLSRTIPTHPHPIENNSWVPPAPCTRLDHEKIKDIPFILTRVPGILPTRPLSSTPPN